MKDDSETCLFFWRVDNPFLPLDKKEAVFFFGSPKLTKWRATLQPELGSSTASGWPVTFSLHYLSRDSQEESYVALEAVISVKFGENANYVPRSVSFNFNEINSYSCKSSIRPDHGKLDIEVKIVIPDGIKGIPSIKIKLEPLLYLSNDLNRLLRNRLYIDMWLLSWNGADRFPVHSYILNSRWFLFSREITALPNRKNPPIVETVIPFDVLGYIVTYLYTGSTRHLHSVNRNFEEYKFDLFCTLKRHPMKHLYKMLTHEPNRLNWDTKTHISSTAVTFRLEEAGELGLYGWTHSPLPDVSVTTFLKFALTSNNGPSFSYSLRFTNPIKLFARVNLEFRRKVVGLGITKGVVVYESDHEIPCNGIHIPMPNIKMAGNLNHLMEFIQGKDRVEDGCAVEHSFYFVLHLSNGESCIQVSGMKYFDQELASLRTLSKHMSTTLKLEIGANLQAFPKDADSVYKLHKAIFEVRIPKWRDVIENPPIGNIIPDVVKCTVSSAALPFVIEYLYTATCSVTPDDLNIEISDFAKLGEIYPMETDIFTIGYERFVAENYPGLLTLSDN